MPIRILLADDHCVLRAGLRAFLEGQPDLQVVGEAGDGDETLRVACTVDADVLLLDISMPGPDGITVTRELRQAKPGLRILVLTMHQDENLLRDAIAAGASGYIPKSAVDRELLSAIDAVIRGDLYVHPAVTRGLLGERIEPEPDAEVKDLLTRRETDILRLIARGYTNQQMADELYLSIRTVETHRANIVRKIGRHTRSELVQYAIEHGVLPKTP